MNPVWLIFFKGVETTNQFQIRGIFSTNGPPNYALSNLEDFFWWTKVFSAALEVGCSKSGKSVLHPTKIKEFVGWFWLGFQETSWNNVDFYFFFWRCSARQNHPNNAQSDIYVKGWEKKIFCRNSPWIFRCSAGKKFEIPRKVGDWNLNWALKTPDPNHNGSRADPCMVYLTTSMGVFLFLVYVGKNILYSTSICDTTTLESPPFVFPFQTILTPPKHLPNLMNQNNKQKTQSDNCINVRPEKTFAGDARAIRLWCLLSKSVLT